MQTGDTGLNSAYKFLKANPGFTQRPIVLVYDSDTNKPPDAFGSVALLSIVKIDGTHCKKGVENLLPPPVFTEDMYQMVEKPGDYGKSTIVPELRKMVLCQSLCGENAATENFENFRPTLELIDVALANLTCPGGDGTNSTDGGNAESSPPPST